MGQRDNFRGYLIINSYWGFTSDILPFEISEGPVILSFSCFVQFWDPSLKLRFKIQSWKNVAYAYSNVHLWLDSFPKRCFEILVPGLAEFSPYNPRALLRDSWQIMKPFSISHLWCGFLDWKGFTTKSRPNGKIRDWCLSSTDHG